MSTDRLALDPKKTALVIIDMQNDFCKPGGTRYGSERIDDAGIARAARLLERCRGAGVRIIFVESVRDPDSPDYTRFKLPPMLMRNTWGARYVEELARRPDEPVVEKNTHDCFYQTNMDALLAKLSIAPETHKIIVMGIAANVCVYQAIMGFHVRHYDQLIPIDCCFGSPEGIRVLESQIRCPGYNYNVAATASDSIDFRPALAA
jgi:ureidoacrylate peracid hydrolase